MNLRIITIAIILFSCTAFSQPELDIKPNRVEFKDLFNRFDKAYLINKGDELLTIDSLSFKESFYIIDFEDNLQLPFTIVPDDSIEMNVTLSGFYHITVSDTSDTIYVYNNGINNPEPLRVKIDFFEDEYGDFIGTVSDSLTPLANTNIYFFYSGVYLLDTATTDALGNYQITLPEGEYTIAAEKESYFVVFHDSTYDPFFATLVGLDSGELKTIDFSLLKIIDTTLSVSGEVIDSANGSPFPVGTIVVRRGRHNPTKRSPKLLQQDSISAFAGFIKPDGTFKVNVQYENYYYVQAYTNYFLPGYYNDEGNASVFWQDADSLLINKSITDKNISLLRDSSHGGGTISGFIDFSLDDGLSDFEGITLLARSLDNGKLYSYNFGKENGEFKITNIPFGTYEVIGQKIGLDNAISQIVTIDQFNNQIQGILINFNATGVEDEEPIIPDEIRLYPNYPNPFNPVTRIKFVLSKFEHTTLRVYNLIGQEVAVLINSKLNAGSYEVSFNADNLSSGIYFYTLRAGNFKQTKKMLLLK
jgi:hypothetical protein